MEQPDRISQSANAEGWVSEDLALRASSRANVYEFLSRVYLEEIAPEILRALRDSQDTFGELGVDLAGDAERGDDAELVEELAAAYCATFLISDEIALYPYESCQREGCLQGESTHLVECFYQQCGLTLPDGCHELADHLGVEFDFMAKLAREESSWWKMGQPAAAERLRKHQRDFLRNHLLVWVPRYCKTVARSAEHPFYRGVGRLTCDFMSLELQEIA